MSNLEQDLNGLGELLEDDAFAAELYSALCNNEWRKGGRFWSCTWRTAGAIVAELRNSRREVWRDRDPGDEQNAGYEDYLDYYCSSHEGEISDRVREQLAKIGWVPA